MRKFIVIKKDQFEEHPDSSILRAEDYKTILNAETIVSEAHMQAENIIAEAKANAQNITDEARAKGTEEANTQMSSMMLNTIVLCQEFLSKSSIYLHKAVTETVKNILSHYEKHEMTLNMIDVALSKHRCTKVLLKVHPNSIEHASSKLIEFKKLHPSILDIKAIKDDSVEEIGCILETDIGNIQATLSAQLTALENVYLVPINPAIMQAVVEKAPEKLKEAQKLIEEAKRSKKGLSAKAEDTKTDVTEKKTKEATETIKTDVTEKKTEEATETIKTDITEKKTEEATETIKTDVTEKKTEEDEEGDKNDTTKKK